jgi:hypothetical protein
MSAISCRERIPLARASKSGLVSYQRGHPTYLSDTDHESMLRIDAGESCAQDSVTNFKATDHSIASVHTIGDADYVRCSIGPRG